ncbi:DUF3108 domain-containing protein [Aquabacterium sp.]|uniref:DUF3108 domain-containing protein n=1 Tax=Aquabacterium sp. TaxID=1872578 RepID=UPI0037852D17
MAEFALAGAPGRGPGHPLLRRPSGWLVLALIVGLHLLAADELLSDRFGWGEGEKAPPRIEVAFVRELQQAAPAPVAVRAPAAERALPSVTPAPPAPASAPRRADKPAPPPPQPEPAALPPPPAQVVAEAAPAPAPAPEPAPPPPVVEPVARVAEPPQPAPAPAVASAPTAEPFEWPPSTRLSYALNGYYRGPIEGGKAQVDWLRSGSRYQVRLEASIGPLFSRQASSDGELGDRGLSPRRFDGEQKQLLRAPRRWSQQFGPERITMPDGREIDSVPGVQDEASQFVQLTWLFTTQPGLLQVGKTLELPLVLNKRFYRWIYEVDQQETLNLPFGPVATYHVKARRLAERGDLTPEMWFAPSLQYLPVRILLRQDESTFIDLTLSKPPLQAAK